MLPRTGHHKAGCSCVVCSGVRRKHGHEEKFGNYADHWNTTEADAAMTPERLFLRLKTEVLQGFLFVFGLSRLKTYILRKITKVKFSLVNSPEVMGC